MASNLFAGAAIGLDAPYRRAFGMSVDILELRSESFTIAATPLPIMLHQGCKIEIRRCLGMSLKGAAPGRINEPAAVEE
jgi:hypothetical protein